MMKLTYVGYPASAEPRELWIEPTAIVAILDRTNPKSPGATVWLASGASFEVGEKAEKIRLATGF